MARALAERNKHRPNSMIGAAMAGSGEKVVMYL